jgi:hypothetical protein
VDSTRLSAAALLLGWLKTTLPWLPILKLLQLIETFWLVCVMLSWLLTGAPMVALPAATLPPCGKALVAGAVRVGPAAWAKGLHHTPRAVINSATSCLGRNFPKPSTWFCRASCPSAATATQPPSVPFPRETAISDTTIHVPRRSLQINL